MSAALLFILAKEIGAPLARSIMDGLTTKPGAADKLHSIAKLVEGGSTAVLAFPRTFGDEFMIAMITLTNYGRAGWTYEVGRA